MAILPGSARLLLAEHQRRPFAGSVLELGKMLVFLTSEELESLAADEGLELRVDRPELSHDRRLASQGCLSDRDFFRSLGFEEVVSSDVCGYEGADVLFDLNEELPDELAERFDVVFDGGTLHHVFDLPQALSNVHRALKVGGRAVIGMAASSNHLDHGFYMFSPTLFHDYFTANRYRLECEKFFEFEPYWVDGRLFTSPWRVYDYSEGCLDELGYGSWGDRPVGIFVVATKTEESTGDTVPRQSYFDRHWEEIREQRRASPPAGKRPRGRLYHLAKRLWTRYRQRRKRRSLESVEIG